METITYCLLNDYAFKNIFLMRAVGLHRVHTNKRPVHTTPPPNKTKNKINELTHE